MQIVDVEEAAVEETRHVMRIRSHTILCDLNTVYLLCQVLKTVLLDAIVCLFVFFA